MSSLTFVLVSPSHTAQVREPSLHDTQELCSYTKHLSYLLLLQAHEAPCDKQLELQQWQCWWPGPHMRHGYFHHTCVPGAGVCELMKCLLQENAITLNIHN